MKTINLPVHAIAHARAGDKGDVSNISLIAYLDNGWDLINNLVTEDKIQSIFKRLGSTKVDRYELPNLKALNFVIHSVLGGGVNSSLRLDRHGKTLSSHLLLELVLPITKDMIPLNSPYLEKFI
ncbi:MAG: hypothetical protein O3A39_02825 [Proteobacteria bacterium]|jgi:hypothetical protein|nr:hypothetical protein [Pseudomonadota bacterium]MDA1135176.1 hypothetical protein [Pseudomonadota bacterium]|tara:strand:+ start:2287 stop:2658 length:372 start_codon:yes stop_codon:yes gene_type:complete